jgi:hypothetical protein
VIKVFDTTTKTPTTISVPVTVKDGEEAESVQKDVNAALRGDALYNQFFGAPMNSHVRLTEYYGIKSESKAGIEVVSSSIENPSGATHIRDQTYGGGERAELNLKSLEGFATVTLAASVAGPNDRLGINLLPASFDFSSYFQLGRALFLPEQLFRLDGGPDRIQLGHCDQRRPAFHRLRRWTHGNDRRFIQY